MIYRKTAIMDRLLMMFIVQGFIGYTGPRTDYAVEQKVTYGIGGLEKV